VEASRVRAVGELSAAVAHGVNNPLAGVLGYSELLLADWPDDDPRRSEMETIRNEALRARDIVWSLVQSSAGVSDASPDSRG
jgi:signal transduction histidine kinase